MSRIARPLLMRLCLVLAAMLLGDLHGAHRADYASTVAAHHHDGDAHPAADHAALPCCFLPSPTGAAASPVSRRAPATRAVQPAAHGVNHAPAPPPPRPA